VREPTVRLARVWAKTPSASEQTNADAQKTVLIFMGKDLLERFLGAS
jgi:hypothetical protein